VVPTRNPIDADRLRQLVGAHWRGIDVVAATGSTNADLLAETNADRTVLVAEHQRAGRGRFDRRWESPPRAGLTFSASVRPAVPPTEWGWLPLLTGVALAEAVREMTGIAAALKWPNDLLAPPGDRKLAGILVQARGEIAVVGIGLNVSTGADELPDERATSLLLEGAADVDRTDLLAAILVRLDELLQDWARAGGSAAPCGLDTAYRALCSSIGRPVRVLLADGTTLQGIATDVDEHGRLLLRTGDTERSVGAGDVEHLRLATG
jgi:BirA family biotin operon repressor/biotin-[acetyl-CoA-carboxylase] ligase